MTAPRKPSSLPLMALALASALVALLAFQNRVLDREVRDLRIRATVPEAGSFVPTFEALTPSGHRALIGQPLAGTRQVLFILNTTCEYCQATLPAWAEIAASFAVADSSRPEIYAISLDPPDVTAAYADEHGFVIPWLTFPDRRTRHLYRAHRVPLTLVVDEYGEVHHARIGLIAGRPAIDSILEAAMIGAQPSLPEWPPAHSGPAATP